MAEQVAYSYDKQDLRAITRAFKAMDDEAIAEAKKISGALASALADKIKAAAATRTFANASARRIADGVSISKSSKVGEFSYGFARQKYSGGATTQMLWGGMEFGSNKYKQFPDWSGRYGRGSRGWFIFPTLRANQPMIIQEWETAFTKILKEWD